MERFTQKLGPLPIWAWAAIGLLALLGYMYWKKTGFFGSGSGADAGAGSSPARGSLSSLLGNQGLIPNPAAYASTGLAGGGSGSGIIGPAITSYDTSATGTPDRGSALGGGTPMAAAPTLANLSLLAPGTVLTAPNTEAPLSIMGFFGQAFTPAVTPPGYVPKTSGSIAQRTFAQPSPIFNNPSTNYRIPTPASTQGRRGGPVSI